MSRSLVIVGDSLLDRDIDGSVERLMPEAPVPIVEESHRRHRPGGAALAAVLAARETAVTLITALGRDQAGDELREGLAAAQVEVVEVGTTGPTPEKIRIRSRGQSMMRLDRGTRRGILGPAGPGVEKAIRRSDAVLVSDYGRGMTAHPQVRALLTAAIATRPVLWDPHPGGAQPVPGCHLATPNLGEAVGFTADLDVEPGSRARWLRERWRAEAVAVTMGQQGATVADAVGLSAVPAPAHLSGDTCGAGDRFAVTAAREMSEGVGARDAVARAVWEATRFVESGGVALIDSPAPDPGRADPVDLARTVRASGGVVVATGGCFDVLHAGHVATLEAARALGDCLIVCLNSDRSVHRLKGPGRPVHRAEDRAGVLLALSSVDAVVVFDQLDPRAVIRRVRPHLWVKGGDYDPVSLPEAEVVKEWGGRVVIVPYRDGLSTTRILQGAPP